MPYPLFWRPDRCARGQPVLAPPCVCPPPPVLPPPTLPAALAEQAHSTAPVDPNAMKARPCARRWVAHRARRQAFGASVLWTSSIVFVPTLARAGAVDHPSNPTIEEPASIPHRTHVDACSRATLSNHGTCSSLSSVVRTAPTALMRREGRANTTSSRTLCNDASDFDNRNDT